jgi:hypothetical protein
VTTIEVRIDRVVLDGVDVPPGQARVLGEALEAELTRLFTAARPGAWPESARVRRADLRLPEDGTAVALGQDIARAIHSGLDRKPGESVAMAIECAPKTAVDWISGRGERLAMAIECTPKTVKPGNDREEEVPR